MNRTGYTNNDHRNDDAARDDAQSHYAKTGEITDEFASHLPASPWMRQAIQRWLKGESTHENSKTSSQ